LEVDVSQEPRAAARTQAVDWKASLYAAGAPLLCWAVPVLGARFSGFPGIGCMSPLAWLLGFWCGMRYVEATGGRAGSALGPAVAGAWVGLGIGALFAFAMSGLETRPDEIGKQWTMTLIMVGAGLVACPALAVTGAWLVRRRIAREGR
jgi:hypothetical protein